jgi:hypothetical protein
MRYRVRTPEGELAYESLAEVQRAYAQGLVAPEDEVAPEGGGPWRRADTVPELRAAQGPARARGGAYAGWVAGCAGLGALALWLLFQESWRLRLAGLAVTLVVTSLLVRLTRQAFLGSARRR